jgi:hypothetical protein
VPSHFRRELGLILAWLVFPLVPVILEDMYYQTCNTELFGSGRGGGPDPREWNWGVWVIMLGPLLGYGFLAGATVDLPDQPEVSRGILRRFLARRAVWMAIGPWCGFLFWCGLYLGFGFVSNLFPASTVPPQGGSRELPESPSWIITWMLTILSWIVGVAFVGTLSYGWLWPAWAALRRAARLGRWSRALYRGLIAALAFVGSLLGSFWAITSTWRSYFFDPTVMPMVAMALGLVMLSGCGGITYGEMRRRELFHAMLVAWVLGLALMWRWWSRRRPGPPRDDPASTGDSP